MMTEKKRRKSAEELEVDYLVEEIGMERPQAERVLEDKDLWIVLPESRFPFLDPEEDVRQWETAAEFARALSDGFGDSLAINDATQQLLWDMGDRAQEALRRARERAEEAEKRAEAAR